MNRRKAKVAIRHPDDVALGKRIKQVRDQKKVSREIVGRENGYRAQQLQKYESGENRVAWSRLCEICDTLGIGVIEMIAPVVKARKISR